jgi:hypothetical protein
MKKLDPCEILGGEVPKFARLSVRRISLYYFEKDKRAGFASHLTGQYDLLICLHDR